MSREMFAVRYYKNDKLKQKEFDDLESAKRFYERAGRRDRPAQLFKFWKESWFDALCTWEMAFLERRFRVLDIVGIILLGVLIFCGVTWPIVK